MPTFQEMAAGYRNMWRKSKVRTDSQASAESAAKVALVNKGRYQIVERNTGVPWFWIAATHYRESSYNWTRSLAQGDPWNKVSTHVPKGRGPFKSWEDAAVDALVTIKKLDTIRSWPIERMLYEFERYNGFGYTSRGVNSPYVWGGTTLQQAGKYVADGVWDANAWDKQLGCAAILKALCVLDGTVAEFIGREGVPPPPDIQPPTDKPAAKPSFWAALFSTIAEIFKRK